MHRLTLHVPEQLNDGTRLARDVFDWIEDELLSLVPGFTSTAAVGAWKSDGRVCREPMRLYAADTDEAEYVLPKLRRLAERIAGALDQEAVYVTSAPIQALLITRYDSQPIPA